MGAECTWSARPGSLTGAAALVLTLVLAGLAATAGEARPRAGGCYPAHTRTLAASTHIRVFQKRKADPQTQARYIYGCLLSKKRPFRFDVPDFPTAYAAIALAGRFVAYAAYADCAASFCDPNSVILQDLRNGRVTYADGALRVAFVARIVLRSNGSLAWIQTTFDERGLIQPEIQVVKAERGQPPVVLDSGADIVGGSLAIGGTTLYWTDGGGPRSAYLG